MSKIIDSVSGMHAEGVIRKASNAIFTDMVELFWIRNTGEEFRSIFPRKTANELLKKHLIPQKQQGVLSDVGITELAALGTN